MNTKEEDLKIARALGCYAKLTSHSKQTYPDALGDRYRGDIEGRRAFKQGWNETSMYLAVKALDLVLREMERAQQE